jgi:hypothetical protein
MYSKFAPVGFRARVATLHVTQSWRSRGAILVVAAGLVSPILETNLKRCSSS